MTFVRPAIALRTVVLPATWTIPLTIQSGPTHTKRIFAVAPPSPSASPARAMPIQPPATAAVGQIQPHLVRTVDRTRSVTPDRTVRTHHHQLTVHTVHHEAALVTRLTARRDRREAADPSATTPAANSLRAPASVPVAIAAVLAQRQPPTPPEPPTPMRSPVLSLPEIGNPRQTHSTAIDMQSLADQVIRTIDQRVVAARERLGAS
jgi:hypothetical protein